MNRERHRATLLSQTSHTTDVLASFPGPTKGLPGNEATDISALNPVYSGSIVYP